MARPLVFEFGGREISCSMVKIDRSKLYGFKETVALDDQGRPCELATLADDGCTLFGRGGAGLGYWTPDGLWCDKASLVPVDLDGKPIEAAPSSFSAPVPLADRTTVDDYLLHNIRAVYALAPESDAEALADELRSGVIYKFPYSYRGGVEPDAGFLLMGAEGDLFLAVGNRAEIRFVGLTQSASFSDDEPSGEMDEADLMDFDMI